MEASLGAKEIHNGPELPPAEQHQNTTTTNDLPSSHKADTDIPDPTSDTAIKTEQITENHQHDEPPSKRRRLTDFATPQRSVSRAASPPWKKVGVEGPTSFFSGGKRKSARTNLLPLELQPQTDKRTTRAAVGHTGNVKRKYGAGSLSKASSASPAQKQNETKVKHSRSVSSAGTQTLKKSPSKPPTSRISTGTANPTVTPTRHSSRKRSFTYKVQSSPTQPKTSSPQQKRRPGRPRRSSLAKMEEARMMNGWHHDSDDEHKAFLADQEEAADASEVYQGYMDCEFEDPVVDPRYKFQRLKFKIKPPAPPPIQHPSQVLSAKRFSSLREWLDNDDPFEGSNMTLLNPKEAKREAEIRNRIEAEARPGGLLDPECSSVMKPEVEEEPPTQRTHQDFMAAHALYFAKLLRQEHRKHIDNARKLASHAQLKWRANQPKSEEELQRERDEREQQVIEVTHRQCLHDLTAKWELLRAEVQAWRAARWQEAQQAEMKESLNNVIDESSRLLSSMQEDAVVVSKDETADEGSENSGGSADEQNMSSDEDENDEADDEADAYSDDQLTAEELRRKYSGVQAHHTERPPDSDEQAKRATTQTETPVSDAEVEQEPSVPKGLDFEDEAVRARIAQAQQDRSDNAADLSEDESTDMDSDDSEEESDGDDETQSEAEDEDESADDTYGLSMLLSRPKAQQAPINAEEGSADAMDVEDVEYRPPPSHEAELTTNDFEEEEIEEVSLIPDAAQVQTPTSNNEFSTYVEQKAVEPLPAKSPSGLRTSFVADVDAPSPSVQNSPADEIRPVTRDSMPATPVSVDLEKKHVPVQEIPHLLRGTLREYQREGFYWLADRYKHNANGILADEMGLGKTIQTITLLAYLALKHKVWGPHLVVVPTSVILNWEMEFKKFLPGFRILPYYGTQEERKQKRRGWLDDDRWNVVITSYQLVVSDQNSFKRRGWHYLILDEAHNIKNFRSQRWQTLLTFRSHARLLLTGTPLQNNLEELWSLLFFLVGPDKAEEFLGRQEFSQLFKKPTDQILDNDQQHLDAEGREQVQKLHHVLRPRLLRRLKADVEKQMPGKYEHVIYCKLSKRQRYLYDGFLSRSQTRETLARGNYLSIINCLMQLRKVCNHPDLFETRPIVTSFAMQRSAVADFEIKDLLVRRRLLQEDESERVSLDVIDLLPGSNGPISALDTVQGSRLGALYRIREFVHYQKTYRQPAGLVTFDGSTVKSSLAHMEQKSRSSVLDQLQQAAYLTSLRSQRRPLYSYSLAARVTIPLKCLPNQPMPKRRSGLLGWYSHLSPVLQDMVQTLPKRSETMHEYVRKFSCVTPAVVVPDLYETTLSKLVVQTLRKSQQDFPQDAFHESRVRLSIAFPDKRLLQYDCGKLQRLDALLRKLQAGGHRALIFTQMTKVLDLLEQFLNIHGHRYLRLDGSTKLEQRQILTERFNSDSSILAFILSSRSGGLGINLTGADTVIFYDLDWNPAMDKQCQDRCHRIGQTRDVHIYRFVSEHTIEANILRKSNQKRLLDDVIIQEGDFTTDHLNRAPNPRDMFEDEALRDADAEASAAFDRVLGLGNNSEDRSKIFEQAEDREDVTAARIAEKEIVHADEADFAERSTDLAHAQPSQTSTSRPGASQASGQNPSSQVPGTQITSTGDLGPSSLLPTDASGMPPGYERGDVAPRTDMSSDIFLEKQPMGVDRFIVEFLEWELRGVPFGEVQAAAGKGAGKPKKKKKKMGKVEEVKVRKKDR